MNKKDLYLIRPGSKDDENFIYPTWLPGLYHGNDWFKEIDHAIYEKNYEKIIEAILSKSNVRVACLKDDESVILGYSVLDGKRLHYVFVKPIWRGIGILRDLVPDDIEVVTHLTAVGLSILKKNYPKAIFNPFL